MKNTEPVVVHYPLTRPRAGVSCVLERVRRPASLPGINMDRCVLFEIVGVCREVYLSKVLQGGGGAGEGRDRGAGGGRDGLKPWATQGMSMGYGEIVCVCVCDL